MKKIFSAILLIGLILSPFFTDAHVKWFTDVAPVKESIENILSPLFMSLTLLAAVVLAFLAILIPRTVNWPIIKKWDDKLSGLRKSSRPILIYGTAMSLMIQVINGTLFAPEFHLHQTFVTVLVWIVIGLLLIPHHIATKLGSIILLGLFIMIAAEQTIFHMLDYGFYVAIIGVLLVGNTKWEHIGFPFLYLGTGLSRHVTRYCDQSPCSNIRICSSSIHCYGCLY